MTISKNERTYANRSERRDRNRRRRWLTLVTQSRVSRGCRAWLLAISDHSDDYAKPIYGMQTKQAARIDCSARTVRRYRCEAERAGLINTKRGKFERRSDGTFGRGMTNIYSFCVPPGRPNRKKSSSHRSDTGDPSNRSLTGSIETLRHPTPFNQQDQGPAPFSSPPPMGWQALKARIGRS